MSSVWYLDVLDSGNWRPSSRRDETTVDVAIPVSSWPLKRFDEHVTNVDDATVAEARPPLITPKDIEPPVECKFHGNAPNFSRSLNCTDS